MVGNRFGHEDGIRMRVDRRTGPRAGLLLSDRWILIAQDASGPARPPGDPDARTTVRGGRSAPADETRGTIGSSA